MGRHTMADMCLYAMSVSAHGEHVINAARCRAVVMTRWRLVGGRM